MTRNFQPVFSLSCPNLSAADSENEKKSTLIIDEDSVYEIDEECMACHYKDAGCSADTPVK